MAATDRGAAARFALVTAAHHFLLHALPFRHPESKDALTAFVETARACAVSSAELDAALLRTLAVLNPHTKDRLPGLVDRDLDLQSEEDGPLARFERCVEDVLQQRGLGDGLVEAAIGIIEASFGDSSLEERRIAATLNVGPQRLCRRFKLRMGLTLTACVRDVRLDGAGRLLVTTDLTIKEVWAAVGYNFASNFDHDFKERFGMTPTEYRARGVPAAWRTDDPLQHRRETRPQFPDPSARCGTVLIVDDDQGTRETIGRYLRLQGHAVTAVATAEEALRQFGATRPDAVLLDDHLPGMDGLTCLRRLRAERLGPPPRVVLFSADWELEARAEELRALDATLASKLVDLEQIESLLFPG